MNKLIDIDNVLKNPKKYGFERVNVKHKGNSIAMFWNHYKSSTSFANFHYVHNDFEDMRNNYGYNLEGITIEKTNLLEDYKVTVELRR